MQHQKVYNEIIEKAKVENRIKESYYKRKTNKNLPYYEEHHIIPRCMNGTDDKENLVLLTAKEHFVCHKLLTYIYPHNSKIACAFHFMVYCRNDKAKEYKMSSRNYAYARELISISRRSVSDEAKNNMRHPRGKQKNPRIKGSMSGKHHSEDTKNLMSIAKIGNKNLLGFKHTEKGKEKMRKYWNQRKKLVNI